MLLNVNLTRAQNTLVANQQYGACTLMKGGGACVAYTMFMNMGVELSR